MMFDKNESVFGVVTACADDNTLTVELDNGETGLVAVNEIGRREVNEQSNFGWMVGRRSGFVAGERKEEGLWMLSGKAYEERLYQEIVRAFREKERNVYKAHLSSVTQDGKLAFYTLAQGVSASVAVADFAYTRIESFNEIAMPKDLTVAIKEIDRQGRIRVYAKLAFGDFDSSIERLALVPGSVADGYVSGYVPMNGDSVVTLAPNLTILTSRAPMGSWVKVQITRVNREEQRLKGEIAADCEDACKPFVFGDWCVGPEEYPAYVEIEDFERRIGPQNRGGKKVPTPPAEEDDIQISYETTATISPFALREGEIGVRSALNGGCPKHIVFESQHGYLTEKHMMAAKAVNDLRYTTSWQVQRYLHLKYGVKISEKSLRSILNRLIKLDIIHTLHFSKDGQCSVQNILYPGATMYREYTGSPRYLPNWSYSAEPDVAQIKCCLSANQLLLGVMHGWDDVREVENRVCIMTESGLRIRPRHKVVTEDGSVIYIESARSDWMNDMLEKLQRYEAYLKEAEEQAKVMITLEAEGEIASFARKVAELQLGFSVLITSDLQCLPEPVALEVPAHVRKSKGREFLNGIKKWFGEVRLA